MMGGLTASSIGVDCLSSLRILYAWVTTPEPIPPPASVWPPLAVGPCSTTGEGAGRHDSASYSHSICPVGSVYRSGLFATYEYRLSAWGLNRFGMMLSGDANTPSEESTHRALKSTRPAADRLCCPVPLRFALGCCAKSPVRLRDPRRQARLAERPISLFPH